MSSMMRKTVCILMALVLCLSGCCVLTAFADQKEPQMNLLENPSWQDDMEGWQSEVNISTGMNDGRTLLRTSVFQEVELEEGSRQVVLSGKISVASQDSSQELIRLGVEFLDKTGSVIGAHYEKEKGIKLKKHEIKADVPPNAVAARVILSIYKSMPKENSFRFSSLCLTASVESPEEEEEKELVHPAEAAGYKCLYSNMNDEAVSKEQPLVMELSLSKRVKVAYITTYHWNDGKGQAPGKISVYEDGRLISSWQASGRKKSKTPNAYWDAKTDFIMSPEHTYTITVSSLSTWSSNDRSGNAGMLSLYGRILKDDGEAETEPGGGLDEEVKGSTDDDTGGGTGSGSGKDDGDGNGPGNGGLDGGKDGSGTDPDEDDIDAIDPFSQDDGPDMDDYMDRWVYYFDDIDGDGVVIELKDNCLVLTSINNPEITDVTYGNFMIDQENGDLLFYSNDYAKSGEEDDIVRIHIADNKLSIGALSDTDLTGDDVLSFEKLPLGSPEKYLGEWLLYQEIDGERKAVESLEVIKDGRYIRMSRGPVGDDRNRTYFVCNYSFDADGNLVLFVSGYLHGSGADAGDTGADEFILHLVDKGHLQYKTSTGTYNPDETFEREVEEEETEPLSMEHTPNPFDEEDEEITGIQEVDDDVL